MYKWILFIVWSNNKILEDWESFNTGEKTKWQDHEFWKRALLSNHYHNFRAQPGWVNYISECSGDNSKVMNLLLTVSCSWTEQWTSIVQHPGISPSSNSSTGKTPPKSEQSILSSDFTSWEKSPSQSRKSSGLIWAKHQSIHQESLDQNQNTSRAAIFFYFLFPEWNAFWTEVINGNSLTHSLSSDWGQRGLAHLMTLKS